MNDMNTERNEIGNQISHLTIMASDSALIKRVITDLKNYVQGDFQNVENLDNGHRLKEHRRDKLSNLYTQIGIARRSASDLLLEYAIREQALEKFPHGYIGWSTLHIEVANIHTDIYKGKLPIEKGNSFRQFETMFVEHESMKKEIDELKTMMKAIQESHQPSDSPSSYGVGRKPKGHN